MPTAINATEMLKLINVLAFRFMGVSFPRCIDPLVETGRNIRVD
jgi:hypothetical protein